MPNLPPLQINKLEDSAAGRALKAVGAASGLLDDFTDFTTSLVRDVFKVVIDSTIDQLEAYAELVAKVSGSLADYEARTLGSPATQKQKALDFLNEVVIPQFTTHAILNLQEIAPSSTLVIDFTASTVPQLRTLFSDIRAELPVNQLPAESAAKVSDPNYTQPTSPPDDAEVMFDAALKVNNSANPTTWEMRASHLHLFCLAKLKKEVKASYDKLVVLLRLGMQKVEVMDGEVNTSLTFHTDSTDSDEITSSSLSTQTDVRSRGFTAALSGGMARRSPLGQNIFSRSLGGSISGGMSRVQTKLKVNVVNEKKTAVTNLAVDITGAVRLRFKTVSFPPFDATNPQLTPNS